MLRFNVGKNWHGIKNQWSRGCRAHGVRGDNNLVARLHPDRSHGAKQAGGIGVDRDGVFGAEICRPFLFQSAHLRPAIEIVIPATEKLGEHA